MLKRINANARFVYKSKKAAEWQTENPVLLKGEIGFVSDQDEGDFVKVGDGVAAWNDLPYKKGPKGDKGDDGNMARVEQNYNPNSENAQSGKAVSEAIKNKLNKIHIEDINQKADITKHAFDVFGTHPCFYANIYDENDGEPYQHENVLVRGSRKAEPATVAVRDGNSVVECALPRTAFPENLDDPIENPLGLTLDDLKGPAIPLHYANKRFKYFGDLTINTNEQVSKKEIVSSFTTDEGLIKQLMGSTMYLLIHGSGENNIRLSVQKDGEAINAITADGKELPAFQSGIVIVPKGVDSWVGKTDWYQKRCLLLAMTGKSLVGIPEFATNQFYFWRNDCPPNFTDKTAASGQDPNGVYFNAGYMHINNLGNGSLSVWEIKV